MNGRRIAARVLVAFASVVLFASAALHSILAYPMVSAALAASNLSHSLQSAMRAVFLLVAWDWIVIGMIVLFAGFTETMLRRIVILFCGVALLVQTGIMLRFLGWFTGSEMIVAAGLLIVSAGFVFPPSSTT
ncbi:MAG: hypothetical protein ABSF75_12545 [Terracidiphilus sp.]